ncbi:MAG: YbaK/EbsC family protein, partial [Planctomycetota bacterium]
MDPYERCLGETDVTRRIRALLDGAGVRYRWVEHGPTRTSEDSARARGEPLEVGGKSIVLRVGETFRVCVISAASRLNSNRVRKRYGQARARFATADELLERTGTRLAQQPATEQDALAAFAQAIALEPEQIGAIYGARMLHRKLGQHGAAARLS